MFIRIRHGFDFILCYSSYVSFLLLSVHYTYSQVKNVSLLLVFPLKNVKTKWIKDLNVRPETIKLLEKNRDRTLDDINQSKILYDPPPRVMEIKTKVNKWDLIKLESFCTGKETISKVKRQH